MMNLCVILLDAVIPTWSIAVCGVVFGWLAWRTYSSCNLNRWERFSLWGLRMVAFVIVAWLLMQPSRRLEMQEKENPVLAVVVDMSASMEDKLPGSLRTRAANACDVLNSSWLEVAGKDFRIMGFGIGQSLEEGLPEIGGMHFTAPRTQLIPSLVQLNARLRGENVGGILLLTDGLDQSGMSLDALTFNAPYLIPELELPMEEQAIKQSDFMIAQLGYPKRVTKGWKATITAHLERRGGDWPATFKASLRQGSKELQAKDVVFEKEDRFAKVVFEVEPGETGTVLYQVAINPENDVEEKNNSRELLMEVTDGQNRILYLEGPPRHDFTFLKRALAAERNLQMSAFIRGADGVFISFEERQAGDGGMKATLNDENLRNFKVLILGDLPGNVFKPEEVAAVKSFVDKGGGLILFGASQAYGKDGYLGKEAFGELAPIANEAGARMVEGARYRVDFTPGGRVLPVFAGLLDETSFPALLSVWKPVKVGEFTTKVIETSDGDAVLAMRRYGQGHVAILLSNTLWKWQLGGSDGVGKGLYGKFITQLIHSVSPDSQNVADGEALQIVMASGEVDLRQTVAIGALGGKSSEGMDCLVTTPAGQTLTLPMRSGRLETQVGLRRPQDGFLCEIVPEETGTYQITVKSKDGTRQAQTLLLVQRPEHELTGAQLNRSLLGDLASRSTGALVPLASLETLREKFKAEPRVIRTVQEHPIWNNWYNLGILLGVFCLEWYLRRRWDLV